MPTKTPPKKSQKPRVQSTQLKKTHLKPWHVLVAIALFIIGGFVVAFTRASSEVASNKAELPLLQYEQGSGTSVVEKTNTGIVQKQGSKSVQITQTGILYCYTTSIDDGTTRQLSKSEISAVLNNVRTSGITQLPSPKSDSPEVSVNMIRYIDNVSGAVVSIDLNQTEQSNPAYAKLLATLEGSCHNNVQPIKRKDAPQRKIKQQSQTSLGPVLGQLVGRAQAAELVAWQDNFNNQLKWRIQQARLQRNIYSFAVEPCLASSAKEWSNTMAKSYQNYIDATGKAPEPKKIIWHSTLAASIPPFCGNNWTTLSENVGVHQGNKYLSPVDSANQMFDAYMASESHRNAILSTVTPYFNVGSTLTSDGNYIINTTHFMRR